jgi:hypothetical protein
MERRAARAGPRGSEPAQERRWLDGCEARRGAGRRGARARGAALALGERTLAAGAGAGWLAARACEPRGGFRR